MSHSGNEHCRNDVCLLRRNHSAGLWTVVLRRGRGASAECSRLLGLRLQGEGTEPEREQVLFQLKYVHDGIVQLSEHHKVDGKAGGTVLGGRIAREPGQSIVLLQNKPAGENTQVRPWGSAGELTGPQIPASRMPAGRRPYIMPELVPRSLCSFLSHPPFLLDQHCPIQQPLATRESRYKTGPGFQGLVFKKH